VIPVAASVFRARWLIPAEGPILEDAALVADGGRIVRIGPWARLKAHVGGRDTVEHFPDAALLPGLVNAHTHLSLSDMRGKLRPTKNFASWIARLAARRVLHGKAHLRQAIEQGAAESMAAGTVAGADLTSDGHLDDLLGRDGARWTVFGEAFMFGETGLARLKSAVEAMTLLASAAPVRVGLSPHTPYTVGLDIFMAARREADARGWPLSTHLHETQDEIAFIERGEGALHTWMKRLHVLPHDWRPAGVRPIRMLADAGFFSGPVLVGHANYLTDDDIAVLAASGSSVVFCPRSHAFFKHTDHPWRRLLAAGVNVCLGTDSLASCPSLSVLDEARFLFAQGGVEPQTLLAMATRRGARALGLEDVTGDLRPGLAAEFCLLEPEAAAREPLATILAGRAGPLRLACPAVGNFSGRPPRLDKPAVPHSPM
jgi:cytosine/adenosine deaminase-related metal-dependent hydrolase